MGDEFLGQANQYRKELLAHCYRMLGSVHDAEDLVQETYLRAWRAYEKFEGQSSLRTWLHRIATNTCLTALENRAKRPLPTGLGNPGIQAEAPLVDNAEVPWLEPVPDSAIGLDSADPATIVADRESVRLAFVAALQHLPPRQRAVLILREVLQWKAAEVAEAVDISVAAVNSTLQRARAQLDAVRPKQEAAQAELDAGQRALLARYVAAFEAKDIAAITALFTDDAIWEMPPFVGWYQGAANIGRLIDLACPARDPGDMKLLPVSANGQPAFGLYMREGGTYRPFNLPVLTFGADGRIAHVSSFFDTRLFAKFGLPEEIPVGGGVPGP
ncbi:RNA polymerase sigma-70 factor (ECF subfamily) [Crossiella equi]|uniref:RNA polymerase sigma factor n=1 Tax=Crossiella equi TaxID=130796 RepID=A0ABS5API1_9PSEU|nr:sigma-70 family RNA polymerase sigma factor [Crossiella equi]MBP2478119.1 RNA polymerase sigma-70 factor (ECF subfamily) [Crossiella equi]